MSEQRRAPRRRTFIGAKISWFNLGASIDCVVRNLSDSGTCLEVDSTVGVPDRFELVFERDQTARPCRVVWRSARRIGVAFISVKQQPAEPALTGGAEGALAGSGRPHPG
jgi:hypothetical protein